MSAILSKAKEQILIYWGVIFYVLLFSAVALGTSWQTATAGIDWSEATSDSKMRMLVGMFVTWGTVMMAFLNKGIAKVSNGELPIGLDGQQTTVTQQQHTETQVTTTASIPPVTPNP